jgi:hypothetical protein
VSTVFRIYNTSLFYQETHCILHTQKVRRNLPSLVQTNRVDQALADCIHDSKAAESRRISSYSRITTEFWRKKLRHGDGWSRQTDRQIHTHTQNELISKTNTVPYEITQICHIEVHKYIYIYRIYRQIIRCIIVGFRRG